MRGANMTLAVVKVGGSLYDLPDLGTRLDSWLATLGTCPVLLVPGGGTTTDVIRALDRCHGLGEAVSHDLALRALTLNAWFLAALLMGDVPVLNACRIRTWSGIALLDAEAFCKEREVADGLPACWAATSDSIAARAAVVLGAEELVLLKSTDAIEIEDWTEAARRGLVDPLFPGVLAGSTMTVRIVNIRS
jgi:aspartokinase-like uncharacterized kinase